MTATRTRRRGLTTALCSPLATNCTRLFGCVAVLVRAAAFSLAANLILSGDADLFEIVGLSLSVSVTAVAIACAIGMTLGAVVAVTRFPGRGAIIVLLNALMGLPPVVVGLIVYILLSRSGPFGVFGLLFTPTAMIIAQVIIITPLIASISHTQSFFINSVISFYF